ncbi:sensor histidine kinase [Microbacterium sp. YY-01]|uniref:sensor histidine kinase n=1 Tax=Microbacterium sp. YY-01 TaxID=3421634 RepID=UPI003D176287
MSIVAAPLSHDDRPGLTVIASSGSAVRAMQVGQHVIAALLIVIGVVRAVGTGTPVVTAVMTGIAVLGWHTLGAAISPQPQQYSRAVWWLVGFAVIWATTLLVSAEFIWLAFLLWLLAGHLLRTGWALLFSAVVYAAVIAAPLVHHGTTSYANVFGPLIGGVFAFGISRGYLELLREAAQRERLVASLRRAQEETAAVQEELAVAQRHAGAMEERTRISRDIHDTIAQSLSSIKLLAHAGTNSSTDDLSNTLHHIETLAADSIGDVRRIVAALVPTQLEEAALESALARLLDRLNDETGAVTQLRVDDDMPALAMSTEIALLRMAQSALANVRLHAHANTVVVTLATTGDTIRLDIHDDGQGFDVAAWAASSNERSSSFGLRIMSDRLAELGGGLDIESTPGEGTALSAYIPHTASEES